MYIYFYKLLEQYMLCESTSPRTRHNFFLGGLWWLGGIFALRNSDFGLHADFIVLVDFQHVLGYIEGILYDTYFWYCPCKIPLKRTCVFHK